MIDKQIGKSNKSSYDNPLAYPVAPVPVSSSTSQQQNNLTSVAGSSGAEKAQVAAGGILKSNFSSNDNPLNFGYYSNQQQQQQQQSGGQNFGSDSNGLDAYKKLPLDAYKKKTTDDASSSPRVVYAAPSPSPSTNNYQPPPPPMSEPLERMKYQPLPPIMSNTAPMYGSAPDLYSPRTRSQQLEQNNREIDYMQQDRSNLRNELDSLSQYPFARRFDPQQSGFTNAESNYNQVGYPPEASMYNTQPQYGRFLDTRGGSGGAFDSGSDYFKLNRDRIVENPNSIHLDVPPYDPIKHRSGYHQGFDYNPWGKPGGGAPLVDPNSGKKYTKKSNILWQDRVSLNEDEKARAIMSMGKNRALSLEEQQREIEAEKQRRKLEEASYKSRTAGDLVTWINYLDDQKAKLANGGRLYRPVGDNKMLREEVRRVEAMKKYHDELGAQMEEKTRNHQLDKLKEDVAGIEHAKTWDDLWGRPGGGAPNMDGKRKRIMDMYQMDATTTNPNNPELYYNNQFREFSRQQQGMSYGGGSVPDSSHKNYYESLQPMRL